MLLHADNVTASPEIMRDFLVAIERLEAAVLPGLSANLSR
jgi:hypothetical protein